MDISGDLLALTLVSAAVNDDVGQMHEVLEGLDRTEEVDQVLRCLCTSLASSLEVNLGKQGALHQIELWRGALISDQITKGARNG